MFSWAFGNVLSTACTLGKKIPSSKVGDHCGAVQRHWGVCAILSQQFWGQGYLTPSQLSPGVSMGELIAAIFNGWIKDCSTFDDWADLGNKLNNLKHNKLHGQKEAECDGRSVELLKWRSKGAEPDPVSSIQMKGCPSEGELRGGTITDGTSVSGARLTNYHWRAVSSQIFPLTQNQIMLSQNHLLQETSKPPLPARCYRCDEQLEVWDAVRKHQLPWVQWLPWPVICWMPLEKPIKFRLPWISQLYNPDLYLSIINSWLDCSFGHVVCQREAWWLKISGIESINRFLGPEAMTLLIYLYSIC